MSALDLLLGAPDPFALFGLERGFDLQLPELEQRHAALVGQVAAMEASDPEKAGRVRAALREGRDALADPVARGRLLLDLLGGAGDPKGEGLPPKFREKLRGGTDATAAGDWTAGERRRLVATASYLFRQLGNADNGVVQRERRRQIRENLNAVEQIDRGVPAPP